MSDLVVALLVLELQLLLVALVYSCLAVQLAHALSTALQAPNPAGIDDQKVAELSESEKVLLPFLNQQSV